MRLSHMFVKLLKSKTKSNNLLMVVGVSTNH